MQYLEFSPTTPETYPIYDSYVEKMLIYFKRIDEFESFKKDDLKTYSRFIEMIGKFKDHYNLSWFFTKRN